MPPAEATSGSGGNVGHLRFADDIASGIHTVLLLEQSRELRGKRLLVGSQPVAREVGLTVRRSWRGRVHSNLALRVTRDTRILKLAPLGGERNRANQQENSRAEIACLIFASQ